MPTFEYFASFHLQFPYKIVLVAEGVCVFHHPTSRRSGWNLARNPEEGALQFHNGEAIVFGLSCQVSALCFNASCIHWDGCGLAFVGGHPAVQCVVPWSLSHGGVHAPWNE